MPELPDVEVFRRRIAATCMQREVTGIRVPDRTALRDVTAQQLGRALSGVSWDETHRHGKHLFVHGRGSPWLVMHFGMTGLVEHGRGAPPDHTRMVVEFADRSRLAYLDMRKLGFVAITDDVAEYVSTRDLGPDALDLTYAQLRALVRSRKGAVKSALMDQALIAGIGNIYSDEIFFHARVDPRAQAADLDDAAMRRLHRQLLRVLRTAADRGADAARLPQSWLLPNREDGIPCPRGNGEIRRFTLSGRGAFYCPACQSSTRSSSG